MFRVIILFVLLAVSFYIVRLLLSNRKIQRLRRSKGKGVRKRNQKKNMLRCIQCGLHIPEEEAIKQGDNVFCSLKHASQHQQEK